MIEQNRWKDISRLYHAARQRGASDRKAFLQAACGGDDALRSEVESLLASEADAGDFLASAAAVELAGTLDADMVSLLGRQVGSYRIDALLGAGGMGEVYRATDTRLNRTVALKILPQHLREVPSLLERFEREARAAAALRHPHICVLYDIGDADGMAFLVMELLEGETLAERLTRGPLERPELFRYAIDIADALAETHRQGVVHGDLKPGNVMLMKEGAKLLDFGLATLNAGEAAAASATADGTPSRQPKTLGGTLPYMAPEQLEGRETDWRIDVFAFGAILYEMVTARKAFEGRTAPWLGTDVADLPAPLLPGAPDWAQDLAPVIAKCLAREPGERWARTLDIADELRRISIGTGANDTTGAPSSRAVTRRLWWRVAALTGVLLALVWWASGQVNSSLGRPPLSMSAGANAPPLTLGNMRQVTADDRLEVDPTFSPDGRRVAYAAGTATGMRIFVRAVGEGPTRALTDASDALEFHPRWSPDGQHILYVTPAGAFVVPASGGTPRQVDSPADTAGSYSATTPSTARRIFSSAIWSPDGQRVAIAYGGSLSIAPADGAGERRRIGTSPYELHSCDWSPNSRWIACVSGNWSFAGPGGSFGNLSPSAILLISVEGGTSSQVVGRTAVHRSPVWSADGRRLYYVSNWEGPSDIYAVEMSDAGTVHGDPVRVTTGLGVYSMAFTADRRTLAYAAYSARANIWSVPIPSAGVSDLSRGRAETRGNQTIEAMRVTRDGRWLLYDSNLHGSFDIFRIALDGGEVERLTTDRGDEFAPDLSPDGRLLAYHSWRTKSRDIFVQPLGSAGVEQVTATSSQESYPAWSPDGQAIAFLDQFVQSGIARGAFLVRRGAAGVWGAPLELRSGTSRVSWAPDGHFLAYARRGAVEILPIASLVPRVLYVPDTRTVDPIAESVQVGLDGKLLYFKSHDEHGRASLWSLPVGGGRPTRLVRLDDPARPSSRTDFAVGVDRLYFTVDDRRCNIWVTDVAGR